jgi:hypothetical protein
MNPRASAAATTSTRRSAANSAIWAIACASARESSNSGVMSLKTMPGFGKSGMSRM